jgi:membrane protein YqaA with SNARE-associated domain
MGVNAIAAFWGFAEATLFFIVPDVWLTAIAVRLGRMAAFRAATWTIAGALIGGAVMYDWGTVSYPQAAVVLDLLPAISSDMIVKSCESLSAGGLWDLLLGSVTGVPYKVFAVTAPAVGIAPVPFLLASIPARAIRFVAAILIATAVNRLLPARLSQRQRLSILGGFWVAFYVGYFALMPN